jgi:hypothetical protein
MEKSLKTAFILLILCLIGLVLTIFISFKPANKIKVLPLIHNYDYILEISNDHGTELYTLYNEEHVLIADSLTCTQLDSVIVEDNR